MIATNRLLLFLILAAVCLARIDPEWKLGTVADSSLLRPSSTLDVPVYAPSGLPVPGVPGVQLMAIQPSQLAIIGEKTAYIIAKPGETARPRKVAPCSLTPRRQVLYYQEKNSLHVLDDNGEVCKIAIAGQEALHPKF